MKLTEEQLLTDYENILNQIKECWYHIDVRKFFILLQSLNGCFNMHLQQIIEEREQKIEIDFKTEQMEKLIEEIKKTNLIKIKVKYIELTSSAVIINE